MPSVRAYIGIGSNLNDPVAQVQQAFRALTELPASRLMACSPLYRSAPVGGPPDQPDYVNAVAALDTALNLEKLLAALQAVEIQQGRVRTVRWGPRTLDVDIIWMDGVDLHEPDLEIPHARWRERRFVLAPLRDLAPELVDQGDFDRAQGHVEQVEPLAGWERGEP